MYLGGPGGGVTNRYDTVDPSFYGSVTDGLRTFYFHTRDQRIWDGIFVQATETDAKGHPSALQSRTGARRKTPTCVVR